WLIGDAFAAAALEAARSAYPDIELNAPPLVDDDVKHASQPPATTRPAVLSYDDERRGVLEQLPERERPLFANQVLGAIRAGVRDPDTIKARIERTYLHWEGQAERWRDGL